MQVDGTGFIAELSRDLQLHLLQQAGFDQDVRATLTCEQGISYGSSSN